MTKLRKLAALAAISAMLPTASLGAPSSEVQRALKAKKTSDYGFLDLFAACQLLSSYIITGSGRDFDSIEKKYIFIANNQASDWITAKRRYYTNIAKIGWDESMERPLGINIAKHLTKQVNQLDPNNNLKGFTERLTEPCVVAGQEVLNRTASMHQKSNSNEIVSSEINSDKNHKQCLDARDYEGCMRVKSSGSSSSSAGDECLPDGRICKVTTKGNDSFGLPKPMGWFYTTHDGDKLVYWTKVYRVPHKGQQTRYLGMKRITRYYQNAKAGTAGSFTSGGTAFTNCTGSTYGTSVNCSTRGGDSRYIPGESATPGGIQSARFDSVYDCKDNTFANYEGKRIMYGGWSKNNQSGWAKLFRKSCKRGTNEIMKLDTMNVQM